MQFSVITGYDAAVTCSRTRWSAFLWRLSTSTFRSLLSPLVLLRVLRVVDPGPFPTSAMVLDSRFPLSSLLRLASSSKKSIVSGETSSRGVTAGRVESHLRCYEVFSRA